MTHLDNIYQLPILIGSTLVLYYSVNPKDSIYLLIIFTWIYLLMVFSGSGFRNFGWFGETEVIEVIEDSKETFESTPLMQNPQTITSRASLNVSTSPQTLTSQTPIPCFPSSEDFVYPLYPQYPPYPLYPSIYTDPMEYPNELSYVWVTDVEKGLTKFEQDTPKGVVPEHLTDALEKIYNFRNLDDPLVRKVIHVKAKDLDWSRLSTRQLSKEFIEEFINYIDFKTLGRNYCIVENDYDLLLSFKNRFDFNDVMLNIPLQPKFFEVFKDIINWNILVLNKNFTEDLILEYSNIIDWSLLSQRIDLSNQFLTDHIHKIKMSDDKIIELFNQKYPFIQGEFQNEIINKVGVPVYLGGVIN